MDSQKTKSFKAHSLLGASSSSRWLNCPPSAIAESRAEETRSSFASEGSLAHALGARRLKGMLGLSCKEEESEIEELSEFHTPEMDEYVEGYVNYVTGVLAAGGKGAELMVEQRLDYSEWVPDGFGTGDAVIVSGDTLDIVDLKYGKGVEVSAEGNTQMMLYALGALSVLDCMYDIERVRMTIYQPRLDNISVSEIGAAYLKEWAEDYVRPLARLAWKGLGNRAAGSWCKFCRVKGECVLLARVCMGASESLRRGSEEALGPEEYTAILERLPLVSDWMESVKTKTLDMALAGTAIPGYKVVEGRSVRRISDPDTLASKLVESGYEETEIFRPRELHTITTLEKLTGKKKFAELSGGCVEKPKGKPALVPDKDRREPMKAADDYAGMELG